MDSGDFGVSAGDEDGFSRSIAAAEGLSVRHISPKTGIHHVILHDNPSCDRLLHMKLSGLQKRRHAFTSNHEQNKRSFLDHQVRKHLKWRKDDEMRANNMNFPVVRYRSRSEVTSGPNSRVSTAPSAEVMYKSPLYYGNEKEVQDAKNNEGHNHMLPYMSIQPERTEILKKQNKLFMTRLPTILVSDNSKLQHYRSYCSSHLSQPGAPVSDRRYKAVVRCLAPGQSSHSPCRSARRTSRLGSSGSRSMSSSSEDYTPVEEVLPEELEREYSSMFHTSLQSFPGEGKTRPETQPASMVSKSTPHPSGNTQSSPKQSPQSGNKHKSARDKIKSNLREKSLTDLVHQYGQLKVPHQGSTAETSMKRSRTCV